MDKKKIFVLLVLAVFATGMLMGSASASKTFTYGKYKGTFSNSKINSVKDGQYYGYYEQFTVKTGKYKKVKKAVYKKKKKYKTVNFGKGKYVYGFLINSYTNKGWTCVKTWSTGRYMDSVHGTMYKNNYAKFKKTVKVKKGYKTKKYPVKMTLSSHYEDGSLPGYGKAVLSVWSSQGLIGEKTVSI